MTEEKPVGFIGLGSMGGAIARRMAAVQALLVHDLRSDAVVALVAAGATAASSVAELASHTSMVLVCLPTSDDVRSVIFGDDGLAGGMDAGGLIVDMTTGDPVATRAMAADLEARDITLVDAPVSGGPQGADEGTLAIMVGGPDAAFARCAPVLRTVSPNVIHTGGVGAGHTMKLVNNMISAGNRVVAMEAVSLGVRNGLDPALCVEIIQKSSGRSYMSEVAFPRFILTGTMDQGFTLGLMKKDVTLGTKLGADTDAPTPVADIVRARFEQAVEQMGPDTDISELMRLFEAAAGVKIVPDGE